MNTEKRKEQFRAYYYRNLEANREKARLRAAMKRAALVETPEQREQRLSYHKQWYQDHREEAVQNERNKRAAKSAEKLPDFSKMTPLQIHQFKMIVISLLAEKHKKDVEYRRDWKRKRYGYGPRKPAAPKPQNIPRKTLTDDQKREKQAEYKRKVTATLKTDPEKYAVYRAKKNADTKAYLEDLKLNHPEKYAAYRKGQTDYERKHKQKSIQRKIACRLRTRVAAALMGRTKYGHTSDLVGCSLKTLMDHLESRFLEGMNWGNFGKGIGKWGMDHIKPVASHDLSDPEQQKKAFHYSNLCPMWHEENSRKSSLHDGRRWRHTDHQTNACNATQTT